MQRLLDILSPVRNVVVHCIHRGAIVAFVVAQLRTRVDLLVPTTLSQGDALSCLGPFLVFIFWFPTMGFCPHSCARGHNGKDDSELPTLS